MADYLKIISYPTDLISSSRFEIKVEFNSDILTNTDFWSSYKYIKISHSLGGGGSSSYFERSSFTSNKNTVTLTIVNFSGISGKVKLECDFAYSTSNDPFDPSFDTSRIRGKDYCYVSINSIPYPPNTITIPESIQGGSSINITWTASTDPDNNLAGYILERKFDSGSWTQVYKGANRSYTDPIPLDKYKTVTYRVKAYDTENEQSAYATSVTRTIQNSTVLKFRLKSPIESSKRARYGQEIMTYTIPSGATFKAEACNNGFDENPTWEDVTELVKKQKIFEFANKTKTASKWGYDIRVTVDRNGATGNCYFTRGNGFFEEEGYSPSLPPALPEVGQIVDLFGYTWLVCHDDGSKKYLITKDIIKNVKWNKTDTTSGGYAASNIKKECTNFANTLGVNSLDYVVDTGVGKVFIPTKDQMTGESGGFSYFDSDSKRIANLNGSASRYWTATPYNSSLVWNVYSDGDVDIFNYAANSLGFRPCICIQYK